MLNGLYSGRRSIICLEPQFWIRRHTSLQVNIMKSLTILRFETSSHYSKANILTAGLLPMRIYRPCSIYAYSLINLSSEEVTTHGWQLYYLHSLVTRCLKVVKYQLEELIIQAILKGYEDQYLSFLLKKKIIDMMLLFMRDRHWDKFSTRREIISNPFFELESNA